MTIRPGIEALLPKVKAFRRKLHACPELAFKEENTAKEIITYLKDIPQIKILDTKIAKTGIIAVLEGEKPGKNIAFRADIDALPIVEENHFEHVSKNNGCMHACGHDGHTAMLVGAMDYLALNPPKMGNLYFIFQPAEEHQGGAKVILEEGLLDRFTLDHAFAIHNWPGLETGSFAVHENAVMASEDSFSITLSTNGGHAAMPDQAKDLLLAGSQLVQLLNTITSRQISPFEAAVISVTQFHAGTSMNILPGKARLAGTVRCINLSLRTKLEQKILSHCQAIANAFEIAVDCSYDSGYPATINHQRAVPYTLAATSDVAKDWGTHVHTNLPPSMGAEDFAYFCNAVPSAYIWLGAGTNSPSLHSNQYDFNDDILGVGMHYWVRLAELSLA